MKTTDFDFDLPERFIAQNPVTPRDSSRLMSIADNGTSVSDVFFRDLLELIDPGDVLVLNNSKVMPARISFDHRGKQCEIFVLSLNGGNIAKCLVRPGKYFRIGDACQVSDDLNAKVLEVLEDGSRVIEFSGNFDLATVGEMPLPPYIKNSTSSDDQYQTVYANDLGSVAAPTAGLHFTDSLISKLKDKGVIIEFVTLHVGRGTFLPVSSEFVVDHKMHSECFELSEGVARSLDKVRATGGRIFAVGTTSVRVLESTFDVSSNSFLPQISSTDIFIYPGHYNWKAVDCLITNFHLPKSSLIMLVASFLEHKGVEDPVSAVLELYERAKANDYRFYSFGDAMAIT